MDVHLDGIRIGQGGGIVAVVTGDDDVAGPRILTQAVDSLIGDGFGGILYLNLEYQVTTALQVEAEADVFRDVGLQAVHGGGEADDTDDAYEHRRHNHQHFDHQISLHYFALGF